jgi:hypothetical protein
MKYYIGIGNYTNFNRKVRKIFTFLKNAKDAKLCDLCGKY